MRYDSVINLYRITFLDMAKVTHSMILNTMVKRSPEENAVLVKG